MTPATASLSPDPTASESADPDPNAPSLWKDTTLAALGSIFIWWASTAILIFFNFMPGARFTVFGTSLILAAISVRWLLANRDNRTVSGAYLAFTAGLLVWAFVEASFYTGFVVGPEVAPMADVDGPSLPSFFHAVKISLYHEILVVVLGVSGLYLFRDAANRFGLYLFLLFWFFHQSAKLNVFFGVANTGEHFLPETVSALLPHMTTRSMNFLFPISVTINTVVAWYLLRQGVNRAQPRWKRVGYVLVGTMAALALAEHWFLVLPLEGTLWDISLHNH